MAWNTIKDSLKEKQLFQRRSIVAVLVLLVLSGALVSRLYYLQIDQHKAYKTLSEKNRVQVQPIPPTRGLIYDRNGVLLAENRPVFSVTIVPEQVSSIDKTLSRLAKIIHISKADREKFRKRLHEYRRPYEPVPLMYNLTEKQIARLAVHRYELPGVEVQAELVRYYPHGKSTVSAVGYVGRINEEELKKADPTNYAGTHYIGKLGVEKFYEKLLHGTVGYQNVEINARGRVLRVLERHDPIPGKNITLTIDLRLEELAHKIMDRQRGAVVAIDPRNGQILAMVSSPSYDPNQFVTGIDYDTYESLQKSADLPLFNRAIRGQYPPGSTIKPFMAIAGLDSGTVDPQYKIFDPGYFQLTPGGRKYRDWKRWGHGWVNLHKAIEESCDTYFYNLAHKMGIKVMDDYLAQFGFGEDSALDVQEAKKGLLPSPEWKQALRNRPWYPGDTVNMGIGQGYMLVTPLQLATATAVLADHGVWHQPHLIKAINDGTPIQSVLPEPSMRNIHLKNPDEWKTVVSGMEAVMSGPHGTARRVGRGSPYPIAGKSGTAQVVGIPKDQHYDAKELAVRLRDNALFIMFGPADKPTIAVAVVVENGGGGSSTAAPVAKQLLDAWILGFPKPDQVKPIKPVAGDDSGD